jgi:hypothetical protein
MHEINLHDYVYINKANKKCRDSSNHVMSRPCCDAWAIISLIAIHHTSEVEAVSTLIC